MLERASYSLWTTTSILLLRFSALVDHFTYLGSIMDEKRGAARDIVWRLSRARGAFNTIRANVTKKQAKCKFGGRSQKIDFSLSTNSPYVDMKRATIEPRLSGHWFSRLFDYPDLLLWYHFFSWILIRCDLENWSNEKVIDPSKCVF